MLFRTNTCHKHTLYFVTLINHEPVTYILQDFISITVKTSAGSVKQMLQYSLTAYSPENHAPDQKTTLSNINTCNFQGETLEFYLELPYQKS